MDGRIEARPSMPAGSHQTGADRLPFSIGHMTFSPISQAARTRAWAHAGKQDAESGFWPSGDLARGAPTVRKGTDGEGQRGNRLIVRDAARHRRRLRRDLSRPGDRLVPGGPRGGLHRRRGRRDHPPDHLSHREALTRRSGGRGRNAAPPIWTAGGSRHPDADSTVVAEEQICSGEASIGLS